MTSQEVKEVPQSWSIEGKGKQSPLPRLYSFTHQGFIECLPHSGHCSEPAKGQNLSAVPIRNYDLYDMQSKPVCNDTITAHSYKLPNVPYVLLCHLAHVTFTV